MVNLKKKKKDNTVLSKYNNRAEDFRPEQEKTNFAVGLRCSSLTKLSFGQGMGLMAVLKLGVHEWFMESFCFVFPWWKGPGS